MDSAQHSYCLRRPGMTFAVDWALKPIKTNHLSILLPSSPWHDLRRWLGVKTNHLSILLPSSSQVHLLVGGRVAGSLAWMVESCCCSEFYWPVEIERGINSRSMHAISVPLSVFRKHVGNLRLACGCLLESCFPPPTPSPLTSRPLDRKRFRVDR